MNDWSGHWLEAQKALSKIQVANIRRYPEAQIAAKELEIAAKDIRLALQQIQEMEAAIVKSREPKWISPEMIELEAVRRGE